MRRGPSLSASVPPSWGPRMLLNRVPSTAGDQLCSSHPQGSSVPVGLRRRHGASRRNILFTVGKVEALHLYLRGLKRAEETLPPTARPSLTARQSRRGPRESPGCGGAMRSPPLPAGPEGCPREAAPSGGSVKPVGRVAWAPPQGPGWTCSPRPLYPQRPPPAEPPGAREQCGSGTCSWNSPPRCGLSGGEDTRAWTARTHPPSARGSPPSLSVWLRTGPRTSQRTGRERCAEAGACAQASGVFCHKCGP